MEAYRVLHEIFPFHISLRRKTQNETELYRFFDIAGLVNEDVSSVPNKFFLLSPRFLSPGRSTDPLANIVFVGDA